MIYSHRLLHAALSWPGAVYALTTRAGAESALASLEIANIDDVRGNLHLAAVDADAQPITWSSSDPTVITADGIVTRQSQDVTVELVATSSTDAAVSRTFTASVRQVAAEAALEGYMMAYFTGDNIEGEKIFFAASNGNSALDWSELNDGEPVLTSRLGTKGLRDPFIMRSAEGDKFFLLATDLSIGSGTSWGDAVTTGSRSLEIWDSTDLVTWSQQRHVEVSPPEAGMTWAPEAHWDEATGNYVVYWASALFDVADTNHTGGSGYHRMLISSTRDFVTFSEPTVWQDAGLSRIDSDVFEEDGVYYRFTKDEGAGGTGCSDIIMEESTNLTSTLDGWKVLDTCIGRDAGLSAVEGPTAFKANAGDLNGEKYYIFLDEYGGRGYIPLETTDITNPNWTASSAFNLPKSPRHGTVLPVTAAELAALNKAYANANAPSPSATKSAVTSGASSDARSDTSSNTTSDTTSDTSSGSQSSVDTAVAKSQAPINHAGSPGVLGLWVSGLPLLVTFIVSY